MLTIASVESRHTARVRSDTQVILAALSTFRLALLPLRCVAEVRHKFGQPEIG